MKCKTLLSCCLLLCIAGELWAQKLPASSPEKVGMSAEHLALLRPIMQGYVDSGEVSGLITAVARRGHVIDFETYGMRDIGKGLPMTRDTIFRIYSMSKPITSVAAMILYEEGRFELTDPVSDYIPEFAGLKVYVRGSVDSMEVTDVARKPTIQDLFRHTAGLTYTWGPTPIDSLYRAADLWNQEQDLGIFVSKIGSIPLLYQPGERFHYSVAVDVLGRLIEVVSGMPFADFVDQKVFKPLNMVDTRFFVPPDKLKRFAVNYQVGKEGELKPVNEDASGGFKTMPAGPSGGGGLVSTVDDYLRFCQMLLNGGELDGQRILSPRTVDFMLSDHLLSDQSVGPGEGFGLGFAITRNPAQRGQLGPVGEVYWSGAANTFFWIDRTDELVYMVWTQLFPWGIRDFRLQTGAIVHSSILD